MMKSNSYAMQGRLPGSGNLTDKTALFLSSPGASRSRVTILFWIEAIFEPDVGAAS